MPKNKFYATGPLRCGLGKTFTRGELIPCEEALGQTLVAQGHATMNADEVMVSPPEGIALVASGDEPKAMEAAPSDPEDDDDDEDEDEGKKGTRPRKGSSGHKKSAKAKGR